MAAAVTACAAAQSCASEAAQTGKQRKQEAGHSSQHCNRQRTENHPDNDSGNSTTGQGAQRAAKKRLHHGISDYQTRKKNKKL
jgi:hypothetical protein